MKKPEMKICAAALAALLLAAPLAPAASATEPFARAAEPLEADRGRPDFGRDRDRGNDRGRGRDNDRGRDRRPPPPRPDRGRDHDRGRDRDNRGGGSLVGSLIGSAIAGLISGAMNDNDEPEYYYAEPYEAVPYEVVPVVPYEEPQPVLVCDAYGNCWYEYPQ